MPMTHAPETDFVLFSLWLLLSINDDDDTENLYQKTGTIFGHSFFSYQMKLEAKFLD